MTPAPAAHWQRARGQRRSATWLAASWLSLLAALPRVALAHGFDERYDLPVPLSYFIAGAAAAVVLSFVVAALFARRAPDANTDDAAAEPVAEAASAPASETGTNETTSTHRGGWITPLRITCRVIALALFILAISTALFGTGDPLMNFAPTFIWIIWWVGLSLFVACVGNVWPVLDPWRTLFDAADALARRLGLTQGLARNWPWPRALGMWPAAILLLTWSWLEVIHPLASVPFRAGCAALVWSAITLTGMLCFGRDTWQRNGDVFALYFELLGRMAPFAASPSPSPSPRGTGIIVRMPGAALISTGTHGAPASAAGTTAFIIAMLSTVLFDGLHGGQTWLLLDKTLKSTVPHWLDANGYVAGTIGLASVWLALFSAYQLTCWVTRLLAGQPAHATSSLQNPLAPTVSGQRSSQPSTPQASLATLLAPTLIPIAVAYNIAHNFSSLVIQGQNLLPLLSDPFGVRWNLFGTANLHANIGLIDARLTWYIAISAIVIGHVIAVWLAHRVALREYLDPKRAALASVPLTILMVAYTALSLLAIAEPMVVFEGARVE